MNKNIRASLVITTYNWPGALELLLLSVLRQKTLPVEIVIADDGSDVITKEVIESFRLKSAVPVKHIWQEDKGFRKTIILNKAILASEGEYIIQVDGDIILDPSFISDHLRVAEQGAFIRGTRAHLNSAESKDAIENKITDFHFYSKGVKHRNNALRSVALSFLGIKKEMSSQSVRGSNLAFWKSDFVKVNGYNNDLCGWGHEDEELAARFINNRIIKKKVKLACVQYHLYHPETATDNEPEHRRVVDEVVEKKILQCSNGILSLNS